MNGLGRTVRAFAPATVANVAVGFDILGFALEGRPNVEIGLGRRHLGSGRGARSRRGEKDRHPNPRASGDGKLGRGVGYALGETATVQRLENAANVVIEPVVGYPEISTDPRKNTAGAGLLRLIDDKKLRHGFRVQLHKQIPIGSGLGGSSVSAVAALVAANALLSRKLTREEMLEYALAGEQVASHSRHADNIAPCLLGGLVLIHDIAGKLNTVKIKTPSTLRCVIFLPKLSLRTEDGRKLLQKSIPLSSMVEQTANLGCFLLGCQKADFSLLRTSLRDVVIEPQRAGLIPAFYELQSSALAAGALGCSISGSGPAMFALAEGDKDAAKIHAAFLATAHSMAVAVEGTWISAIATKGAYVLDDRR